MHSFSRSYHKTRVQVLTQTASSILIRSFAALIALLLLLHALAQ